MGGASLAVCGAAAVETSATTVTFRVALVMGRGLIALMRSGYRSWGTGWGTWRRARRKSWHLSRLGSVRTFTTIRSRQFTTYGRRGLWAVRPTPFCRRRTHEESLRVRNTPRRVSAVSLVSLSGTVVCFVLLSESAIESRSVVPRIEMLQGEQDSQDSSHSVSAGRRSTIISDEQAPGSTALLDASY